jgi:hypothetical protein
MFARRLPQHPRFSESLSSSEALAPIYCARRGRELSYKQGLPDELGRRVCGGDFRRAATASSARHLAIPSIPSNMSTTVALPFLLARSVGRRLRIVHQISDPGG